MRETPRCSENSSTMLIFSCSVQYMCVIRSRGYDENGAMKSFCKYREQLRKTQRLAARKRQQFCPKASSVSLSIPLHSLLQATQVTCSLQASGRQQVTELRLELIVTTRRAINAIGWQPFASNSAIFPTMTTGTWTRANARARTSQVSAATPFIDLADCTPVCINIARISRDMSQDRQGDRRFWRANFAHAVASPSCSWCCSSFLSS